MHLVISDLELRPSVSDMADYYMTRQAYAVELAYYLKLTTADDVYSAQSIATVKNFVYCIATDTAQGTFIQIAPGIILPCNKNSLHYIRSL